MGWMVTFLHSDFTSAESTGWDRKTSMSITGREMGSDMIVVVVTIQRAL